MTREEFYQSVYEKIASRLADCYKKNEITLENTYLEDGRQVMMLMFVKEGSLYAPGFNLDEYYEQYLIQIPMEEYLFDIEKSARSHASFVANSGAYKMERFEDVADKIRIRLMALKNVDPSDEVYTITYDHFLAQFKAEFKGDNQNSLLIPIHEKVFQKWSISDEDLLEAAFEKQLLDGVVLSPLDEATISDGFQLKINYWTDPPAKEEAQDAGLLVLTNPNQYWGASLIINPDVMDGIYKILGVNFYILPSSIHEVMILADNGNYDMEKLSTLITSINESEVTKQDILADDVFYYDAKRNRLLSGKKHGMNPMNVYLAATEELMSETHGMASM